jgi:hypothetical protein
VARHQASQSLSTGQSMRPTIIASYDAGPGTISKHSPPPTPIATPPPPSLAKGRNIDKLSHYAQAHLNVKALDILCVRCAATATRDLQDWSALEATPVLGPEACWPGMPDIVHPEVTQTPNTEIL